jgi:hypothetical protein
MAEFMQARNTGSVAGMHKFHIAVGHGVVICLHFLNAVKGLS